VARGRCEIADPGHFGNDNGQTGPYFSALLEHHADALQNHDEAEDHRHKPDQSQFLSPVNIRRAQPMVISKKNWSIA
jgi:hypothetical protein